MWPCSLSLSLSLLQEGVLLMTQQLHLAEVTHIKLRAATTQYRHAFVREQNEDLVTSDIFIYLLVERERERERERARKAESRESSRK